MIPPFERKPAMRAPVTHVDIGVAGHFKLVAGKQDGSRRELAAFQNMLLDQGLNYLLDNVTRGNDQGLFPFARAWVGASSAPEDPGQTGLISPVASAVPAGSGGASFAFNDVGVHAGAAHTEFRCVRTVRFGEGIAAGNIAEVGMGRGYESQPELLSCRALVRDTLGNPTTVEVFSDEFLDLTYTLSVFIEHADKPFTLNLASGQHDGLLRPGFLSPTVGYNYNTFLTWGLGLNAVISNPFANPDALRATVVSQGTVGPVTAGILGTRSVANLTFSPKAAVPAPFTRDVVIQAPLTVANLPGGFSAMGVGFGYWLHYQMSFDPPIPKTAEHIFTITLRISLSRR